MEEKWEPTRHGGFRRTRVAQNGRAPLETQRRSVPRNHPRVLIKLAEPLGLPSCPYAIRWRLEVPFGSVRVHHWLAPDDDRAFHDHPWWFWTFVFKGMYTDVNPLGRDRLRAPAIRFRPALHRHTVVPCPGAGAWTFMITGRPLRAWGFWARGGTKFVKANKWFLTYGHHPCD